MKNNYCYFDIKSNRTLGSTSGYIGIPSLSFSGSEKTMKEIANYVKTTLKYDISKLSLTNCNHIILKKLKVQFMYFNSLTEFKDYMKK